MLDTNRTEAVAEQAIHFCEDCDGMLYAFCLGAHVHGPADARSLEIVRRYHADGCAWVARAEKSIAAKTCTKCSARIAQPALADGVAELCTACGDYDDSAPRDQPTTPPRSADPEALCFICERDEVSASNGMCRSCAAFEHDGRW